MADGSTRSSTPITPEGAERLRRELERLWKVERPRVTREVAAAAAHGDRSENAEYIYGKRRLREIDSRIRFLTSRLESVEVVEGGGARDGRVYFGAWVTVEDAEGGRSRYRLVGSDETDVDAGHISVASPLGRALLGRREDDEVEVARPAGRKIYTIVCVEDADG